MIENIKIANFRGLDIELKDCTQVNIIVGKARSGKTTILEETKIFFGTRLYWEGSSTTVVNDQASQKFTEGFGLLDSDRRRELKKKYSIIVNPIIEELFSADERKKHRAIFQKIDHDIEEFLDEGMGLTRFRNMITAICTVEETGVIAIDDIEIGWHKSVFEPYLKWILKLAKEKNVQLFISTHSLELIDAILFADINMDINEITLFNLDRKRKRFYGSLLKELRCSGLEVR